MCPNNFKARACLSKARVVRQAFRCASSLSRFRHAMRFEYKQANKQAALRVQELYHWARRLLQCSNCASQQISVRACPHIQRSVAAMPLNRAQAAWREIVAEILWRCYFIRFRSADPLEFVIETLMLMGVRCFKSSLIGSLSYLI